MPRGWGWGWGWGAAQYPFGLAAAGEDYDCMDHLQSRCSCMEVEHDGPSSNV